VKYLKVEMLIKYAYNSRKYANYFSVQCITFSILLPKDLKCNTRFIVRYSYRNLKIPKIQMHNNSNNSKRKITIFVIFF